MKPPVQAASPAPTPLPTWRPWWWPSARPPGRSHCSALPFPPSHPEARGQHSSPSPESFLFPRQVHPGQPRPGVRGPHSSGFTPPDACVGGEVGQGGWAGREEEREGKFRGGLWDLPLCPQLWDQGHEAGRTPGAIQAPSRVGRGRREPLGLSGFGRKTRPPCRHSRNCKRPTGT